ncbi:unnamed protein product [Medioppia subpectinata]|uniref:C2H2-type domain-containing protein n=1 Tax=Medioppia subpectinata TaxID=1979941 RepID=A0A7R9LC16_9ACAR|nr:unnamed protein product [Medioppia subpectinata]CAG2117634.1 unnamed protein product [Medioppia subpectinata]
MTFRDIPSHGSVGNTDIHYKTRDTTLLPPKRSTSDTNEDIVRPDDGSVEDINGSDNEQRDANEISYEIDTKPLITDHLMSGTDNRCNTTCGQSFESNEDLGPHVRTHVTDDHIQTLIARKPKFRFNCLAEECDHKFFAKTSLIEHMNNKHKMQNIYECEDCDAVCLTTDEIIGHRHREHEVKTLVCTRESCEESFTEETALKRHIQDIHTNSCEQSFGAFNGSDGVIAEGVCDDDSDGHIPFKCPVIGCGFQCERLNQMKTHMSGHIGNQQVVQSKPSPLRSAQKRGSMATTRGRRANVNSSRGPPLKKSHNRQRINCTINGCRYSSIYRYLMTKHMYTAHESSDYDSEDSEEEPTKTGRSRGGRPANDKRKPVKCDYKGCDKTFTALEMLRRHQSTHSTDKRFKCTVNGCGYSCPTKCLFDAHMYRHRGITPFKCTHGGCGKGFTRKYHLQRHSVKVHALPHRKGSRRGGQLARGHRHREHEMKTFVCTHESCGKSFAEETAFKRHIQDIHTSSCEQSFGGFSGSDGVIAEDVCDDSDGHIPFKCPVIGCDFQCERLNQMKTHMSGHIGNQLVVESKPSPVKSTHKLGSMTATRDRPANVNSSRGRWPKKSHNRQRINCTVDGCGYSCIYRYLMNEHMFTAHKSSDSEDSDEELTTTGGSRGGRPAIDKRKPIKCDYKGCDKTFSSDTAFTTLRRHRLTHSTQLTDKQFKCTVNGCGYSSFKRSKYEAHVNSHRGIKPFKCTHEGCGKGFILKNHLKRHSLKQHS